MPEIAPATPLIATATPTAPTVAPAAPTQDFMGQLVAALKSLAGALPVLATSTVPSEVTAPPAQDQPAPTAKSDKPSDDVMEVLASLGMVIAPPAQLTNPQTTEATSATAGVAVQAPPAAQTALLATAPLATASQALADATADAPTTQTVGTQSAEVAAPAPAATVTDPKVATALSSVAAPDATVAQSVAQMVAPQAPQSTREQQPTLTTATPVTPLLASAVQLHFANAGNGAFQQHTGDSADHRSQTSSESVAVAPAATAASDQTIAAPVAQQAGVIAAPNTAAPAHAQTTQVVSQIAQQVDLYRLPGNKGVRIQLHPEDLGGVQVTVRYAAGGGLELHINVEHATTGALVEAGWSQLRDALATQGFSPDRLVMSVTGPTSANQLDLSSSGGGAYRSDTGLAAFTQGGQSGQQQNGRSDDSAARRAWSPGSGESRLSDDQPRAASTAGTSRIDYRV